MVNYKFKCSCGVSLSATIRLIRGKNDILTCNCPKCKTPYKASGQFRSPDGYVQVLGLVIS